MNLKPVTKENLERVRHWRNEWLEALRTPFMLTEDQQEAFYESLQSRTSNHRYYELWEGGKFIGLGGIAYIQWENRLGEISLILDPRKTGKGLGTKAVDLLYRNAFFQLNLNCVFGECYLCNKAVEFWKKWTIQNNGYMTYIPCRKYWNGRYWDSLYFSITRDQYEKKESLLPDGTARYLQDVE